MLIYWDHIYIYIRPLKWTSKQQSCSLLVCDPQFQLPRTHSSIASSHFSLRSPCSLKLGGIKFFFESHGSETKLTLQLCWNSILMVVTRAFQKKRVRCSSSAIQSGNTLYCLLSADQTRSLATMVEAHSLDCFHTFLTQILI